MGLARGVIYPEQVADGQQLGTACGLVSHLSQYTNVNYQKLTADCKQIWSAIAFHARSQSSSQQPSVQSLEWTQAATFVSTRPFAKGEHHQHHIRAHLYLLVHVFRNICSLMSRKGESERNATVNSMSNFYRLLHKPVGTAVREGAQETIGDCKPMKASGSYILYIWGNIWVMYKGINIEYNKWGLLQDITLCPLKWAAE